MNSCAYDVAFMAPVRMRRHGFRCVGIAWFIVIYLEVSDFLQVSVEWNSLKCQTNYNTFPIIWGYVVGLVALQ